MSRKSWGRPAIALWMMRFSPEQTNTSYPAQLNLPDSVLALSDHRLEGPPYLELGLEPPGFQPMEPFALSITADKTSVKASPATSAPPARNAGMWPTGSDIELSVPAHDNQNSPDHQCWK